ncbi:F-box/LRR-repeat protein At1g55660-like [Lactuca sativa]|uniref:F-box domain-containing protein n=1 Tax=Lactuca sativa TaxID=4236 RepID=A0A9R1W433_LACSA|nr:F-box/LRR-repeat protein At1g55660-like [Lactuca sativa]KAJ0215543.1 hypothetical protein LSAT_V11C300111450 [Lactuca sativa]
MEFDHNKVKRVVEEDRLSSLPDELRHKILSSFDMKFAVQTCLLSSRWKLLWTSMPCLNFSSWQFGTLCNFAKFVTHILSHHNHPALVSSINLNFLGGVANHLLLKTIAKYAFSHNVQQLNVVTWPVSNLVNYPPCLLSSQSLKHFTFSTCHVTPTRIILKTPLDFPALTTLHLSGIKLCDDLFSKCVSLKDLTIEQFAVEDDLEVFDIIAPRLCNLRLIYGSGFKLINVIAPQLENLTIIDCSINYLKAPPGLSSLCYTGYPLMRLCKVGFHSLNKATIGFFNYHSIIRYKVGDARKIINMLLKLHSVRYLTLNADIIECLSSFPDLLSHFLSPFSNLICLTIDYKDAYKVKMYTEVINFLLENSPSATFIMKLPKKLLITLCALASGFFNIVEDYSLDD